LLSDNEDSSLYIWALCQGINNECVSSKNTSYYLAFNPIIN